jgi:PPOX class probable F420-dependent enzyme
VADVIEWSAAVLQFIERQRVARLATADAAGRPHVVPLCYAFDGARFHFVIDAKPKRDTGHALKRMRNLEVNPSIGLLIDHYDENWSDLAYVLVHGTARPVDDPAEYDIALARLRTRYPQYHGMDLRAAYNPVVRIEPLRVNAWGRRFGT